MPKVTLTHRGWFLLCPVYLADLEAVEPFLEPRRFIPDWWMAANEFAFGVLVVFARAINPESDPPFPILVTGDITPPLTLDAPTDPIRKEIA